MVREIPPEIFLSWPIADYENPVVRGPALIVLTGVLIILVTVVVILRLYVRIIMLRWFAADDIFMLFSYVSGAIKKMLDLD